MIKSVGLLTRKAGLSHEEFVKHWLEVQAPLAHAVPGARLDIHMDPGVQAHRHAGDGHHP